MSRDERTLEIESLGAYVPRRRLAADELGDAWETGGPSGIERLAVPGADEDVLTMAYEAATAALEAGDIAPETIEAVSLATTTPPLAEESSAARLAGFLGIDGETRQVGGSTAAGVSALLSGLEASSGPVLVVASDAPRGELNDDVGRAAGAGAAAAILTDDGPGAVESTASTAESYPGTRFRPRGDRATRGLGITTYDRSAFRETLGTVADRLSFEDDTLDAAAIQAPDGALPYRACDRLGVTTEQVSAGTIVSETGDTGTASALLGLAAARSKGHERLLLLGYGSGAEAGGALLELGGVPVRNRTAAVADVSYTDALRLRGDLTSGEPDGGGAYVSVPTWRRSLPQRHRLEMGRCGACGALNLRPSGACTDCRERATYESVALPGTGTIEAATSIQSGGAPPEFTDQQARSGSFVSAIVALDGPTEDDAVTLPLQVDPGDGGSVDIGDRVDTTIRRLYTQEELPRYGRKAVLESARR